MTKVRWLRIVLTAVVLLGTVVLASQADDGDPDDGEFAQIAFVLDGSQSIDPSHFLEIRWALIRAITAEIVEDRDRVGQVEICVVQFGIKPEIEPSQIRVEINPVVVTAANLVQIRDRILAIQQGQGYTPTGDGIRKGTELLVNSPNYGIATRRIINIITDGGPYDLVKFPGENSGNPERSKQDAIAAAAEAQAAGIQELNAEGFNNIGAHSWVLEFFHDLAYPQPAVQYAPGQATPEAGYGFVFICTPVAGTYDLNPPVHQKLRYPFPSDTPTHTPTVTQTPSHTPTQTPTQTYTPSPTGSATATATASPTGTRSPTLTPTITPTRSPTPVAVPEGGSGMLMMLGLIVLLGYGGLQYVRLQGGRRA